MGREGTTFLMIPIPKNKNRQALRLTVFKCDKYYIIITSF